MAFPQPNSRELQNRKILEEIQLKKQLLLKQGVAPTLGTALTPLAVPPTSSATNLVGNQNQMACMRLRELEECLQQLDGFEEPKILLEQYATSAHIGAHILHTAQTHFGDIEGCAVADLGAGCGVLSLGAQLLDASHVVGFEIDPDAISILRRNCLEVESEVEVVQCDLLSYLPGRFEKYFDTVVMNPPFGTKRNAGTDMKFLEVAVKLARKAVYSLHKTSTRDHVIRRAKRLGTTPTVVAELRYDLPHAYKFHKNTSVDVQVDFLRLELD